MRADVSFTADFLTIPMFLLTLSVRNGQPLFRKETPVMILIGCAGASASIPAVS